jgi:hypothetical protein
MPLKLWIHGPGYGESIVLAWNEIRSGRKTRCAAVMDACRDENDLEPFVCRKLASPEVCAEKIPFIACTHPHDDHISAMPELFKQPGLVAKIERVLWWGGHHRSVMNTYLNALLNQAQESGNKRGEEAISAHFDFVHGMCWLAGDFNAGGAALANEAAFVGVQFVYQAPLADEEGWLRVWSISPHLGPQKKFRNELESRISHKGGVTGGSLQLANHTSLGFLIEYGETQIILGGDVTSQNWRHFHDEWKKHEGKPPNDGEPPLPKLNPQVVKVAHHGSKTGDVIRKSKQEDDGACQVLSFMWSQGKGFFGAMEIDEANKPLAVVMPWNNGGSFLPDEDVLDRIHQSGFRVFVTGENAHDPYLEMQSDRYQGWDDAHAYLRIHTNKKVEEDLDLCMEHIPEDERLLAKEIATITRRPERNY